MPIAYDTIAKMLDNPCGMDQATVDYIIGFIDNKMKDPEWVRTNAKPLRNTQFVQDKNVYWDFFFDKPISEETKFGLQQEYAAVGWDVKIDTVNPACNDGKMTRVRLPVYLKNVSFY
jgi:hypothetical protein